jgi:DNA recombination protein RmuC
MELVIIAVAVLVGTALGVVVGGVVLRRPAPEVPPPAEAAATAAELRELRDVVARLDQHKAAQHGELVARLEAHDRVGAELRATTHQLHQALSNSRARGQWGERMAEDVLRNAGMHEGINYCRQLTLPGGARPDLSLLLPEERFLHVDVKFPFDNYLRVLQASTDAEVAAATKAFLADVRGRMKELSARDYTDPETTVGHVVLFIPNEAVYSFVLEHDPSLIDEAQRSRVTVCSPFTFIAVLSVIRTAVDTYQLARTSDQILGLLGDFNKQWHAFTAKFDQLGRQLETASKSFDDLTGTRSRMLDKQLDKIEALRAAREVEAVGEPPVDGVSSPEVVAVTAGAVGDPDALGDRDHRVDAAVA